MLHLDSTLRRRLLGLIVATAVAPAVAHQDHGKPTHGGLVAEGGMLQGELVVSGATLTLHLSDHGQPVTSAGASGRLIVLVGGQKQELALAPAGENRLSATAAAPLPSAAKMVVTVRLPDGRSASLRFEQR